MARQPRKSRANHRPRGREWCRGDHEGQGSSHLAFMFHQELGTADNRRVTMRKSISSEAGRLGGKLKGRGQENRLNRGSQGCTRDRSLFAVRGSSVPCGILSSTPDLHPQPCESGGHRGGGAIHRTAREDLVQEGTSERPLRSQPRGDPEK